MNDRLAKQIILFQTWMSEEEMQNVAQHDTVFPICAERTERFECVQWVIEQEEYYLKEVYCASFLDPFVKGLVERLEQK